MRARYMVSAAMGCLLLTSGLAYAQTPAETRRDEPRKERVDKDQPARSSESRSEAKPQERMRGETGTPRQAGDEREKSLNAAERSGARPDEQKGARGEAAKPNEHADDSRHQGAAQTGHDNRDERTKSSAAPKAEKSTTDKSTAEKPAAEKSSQDKSADETKSKSGAAANQNSQTQRNETAKGSPAPSQPSPPQGGTATNEADKAKGANEAQHGAAGGAQPTNDAQRGANNAAQPNSATAASSQLPRDKEVRISETLRRQELPQPERNLNISITIGAQVPERVRVHRLPPEIVSIAPEYRDYDYFTTDDNIIIVEPRTHRIVSEVPRDVSRSRAETQGATAAPQTTANVAGGSAAPCQIQKRDASGQLTEVAPTTVGSTAQGRNSIAVIVQTPDQRSTSPIALDAAAGQIVVASQGPGDCRVTIEPEPAR